MRASIKKAARGAAWGVGGLLLFVCLVVAGVFIWLRTEHGEKTLAALAVDAAAGQGVTLSLDGLSGPLPQRLALRGIRLADGDGVWFAADSVEIQIDLKELFSKTVSIPLIKVDAPRIYRTPEFPPSQPPETAAVSEESAGFSSPVALRVEALVVNDAAVYAPLLFPDAPGGKDFAAVAAKSPLITASVLGNVGADAGAPLLANAALRVRAADVPQLETLLQTGSLPVRAASLAGEIALKIGKEMEAGIKGSVDAAAWDERLTVAYDLDARMEGTTVALRKASLNGLGVVLTAEAKGNLDPLTLVAEVSVKAADGGEWQKLVERAGGERMGGALAMRLDAALSPGNAIDCKAALRGSALRWPTEELQNIFGETVSFEASATGGGGSPYAVLLKDLKAGIVAASGKGVLSLEEDAVTMNLAARLAELAPLAPGVAGAVSATASVSGKFSAPKFSVDVAGDALTTDAGEMRDVQASLHGEAALPSTGAKSVSGTVKASLGGSPAGPVRLSAAYAARQDSGGLTARVRDVDLVLAGTNLAADITARIPTASTGVSLDGTASAAIMDWKPLAALTGLRLSGDQAGFDASFTHTEKGQNVSAAIRADALTMKNDADGNVFSIRGFSGTLEAKDLSAMPEAVLTARLGQGEAGPLNWESGALSVNLLKDAGTFAAALRADGDAEAALTASPARPDAVVKETRRAGGPSRNSGKRSRNPNQPARAERLTIAGSFSLSPVEVALTRLSARMPDSPLGVSLAQPAVATFGDSMRVRDLKLNITPGGGSIACDASFEGAAVDLAATVVDLPFRLIREAAGAPLPDGAANASVVLRKRGATVQGTIEAKAEMTTPTGPEQAAGPPVVLSIKGTLDDAADPAFPHLKSGGGTSRLKGEAMLALAEEKSAASGKGSSATAPGGAEVRFNLPLRFSPEGVPAPDPTAAIGASLSWRGDVAPVWALVPMPDRRLSGAAQVDAAVKGSLNKPEYVLNAYMAGGRFEDGVLGLLLSGVAVEATSSSSGETKLIARAEDGRGGFAALEGRLLPPEKASQNADAFLAPPRIAARGHISRLQPLHRDDLFVRVSGRLSVEGEVHAPKIGAQVEVEHGELSLLTTLGGGVRTLEIEKPEAKKTGAEAGPACDIKVTIPGKFYIRGRGLDSEWEGSLAVKGPLSGPSLTGSLRPVRGSFDLLSRAFMFSDGDIAFFGGDRINPALNLTLSYTGPNITALVRAQGTANKPKIVMESRPPLPKDQIMAEVLFGKEFSALSRFEALQVANSVRQLANIGDAGLDPVASLRTKLGVDMLRVGSSGGGPEDGRSVSGAPGADSLGAGGPAESGTATPTVEAGKYINDAIYVGVEQGASADSTGVRVEVELRPNVALQGKTSARSSEVGLGWKKDY